MAAMEACPNCGLHLAGKARLCPRCGGRLDRRKPTARRLVTGQLVLALAGLALGLAGSSCAVAARNTDSTGADYLIAFGWLYGLGGLVVFVFTLWPPRRRARAGCWVQLLKAIALLVGIHLALSGFVLSLLMFPTAVGSAFVGGLGDFAALAGMFAASLLLLKAGVLLLTWATATAPGESPPDGTAMPDAGTPPVARGG